MKQINEEMLFAGHGGQGIMVMGRLIAYTAMNSGYPQKAGTGVSSNAGYEVTGIPSYGAEVRGGTAHAMVKVKTGGKIANPLITNPSICVVMNKLSLDRFMKLVKARGLLLIDDTNIKEIPVDKRIEILHYPFTKMAIDLGDKRTANMIAIGALNKVKCLFPLGDIIDNLKFIFPGREDLIELNKKAIETGYKL